MLTDAKISYRLRISRRGKGSRKQKGEKMKTIFFEADSNGERWIDIETNADGAFDIVLKTQGFEPDGGLYADVSRDVLGYGFETEEAAEKCAAEMAGELGF